MISRTLPLLLSLAILIGFLAQRNANPLQPLTETEQKQTPLHPNSQKHPQNDVRSGNRSSLSLPDQLELPPSLIRQIATLHKGNEFTLSGFSSSAVVTIEAEKKQGAWMRSLQFQENDMVFVVTREPNGQIQGNITSMTSSRAWSGTSQPGQPLLLTEVERRSLLPECAAPPSGDGEVPIGPPGSPPPALESSSNSPNVLYLDFDGETISDTQWNAVHTEGAEIVALPPNLSPREVKQIWEEVSEDFRPFDINVTTDRAVYDEASVEQRYVIIVTPSSSWHPGRFAGLAFSNSFGSAWSGIGWVFPHRLQTPSDRAIACSHEAGHAFGLVHDGAIGQEYYSGHGEAGSPTSWGPIMGAAYGRSIVQWSNGDYLDSFSAVADQDDVAVISETLGLTLDEDENNRSSARNLRDMEGDSTSSLGIRGDGTISTSSDNDWFYLDVETAPSFISLEVTPFQVNGSGAGQNLDISASLLSQTASIIESTPTGQTSAEINFEVTSPGRYYLRIEGSGMVGINGYPDYGSLGCYSMTGKLHTGELPFLVQNAPDQIVFSGDPTTLSPSIFAGSSATYQWQFRSDGNASWTDLAAFQPQLNLVEISPANAGQYRVIINQSMEGEITSDPISIVVRERGERIIRYKWEAYAGRPGGTGYVDGLAKDAQFAPYGIALDTDSTIYVGDLENNLIRKITSNGIVTTLAGKPRDGGGAQWIDGTGPQAFLKDPRFLILTPEGNIIFPDTYGFRKMDKEGSVESLNILDPNGFIRTKPAMDEFGNIYYTSSQWHQILKVNSEGETSIIAGQFNQRGTLDGNASEALFFRPTGLVRTKNGILYVSDTGNNRVRKITPDGQVSTLAILANTNSDPLGIALDNDENIIVAAVGQHVIWRITPTGEKEVIAGELNRPSFLHDPDSTSLLSSPVDVAVDSGGTIYFTEEGRIRKFNPGHPIETISGKPNRTGIYKDGPLNEAAFRSNMHDSLATRDGNLYIAENSSIRKISPTGEVINFVGIPTITGSSDGTGQQARLQGPKGLSEHPDGSIYFVSNFNHTVRRITINDGNVTTIAGSSGERGFQNGTPQDALFSGPNDLAINDLGEIFIADRNNKLIRKIDQFGTVSTFAGNSDALAFSDGLGSEASFLGPTHLAFDPAGNLLVTDTGSILNRPRNLIRKITPAGLVSTLEYEIRATGFDIDLDGNIYISTGRISNTEGNIVTKIFPNGERLVIGGKPGMPGISSGIGSKARFPNGIRGLSVAQDGTIYLLGSNQGYIIRGIPLSSIDDGTLSPSTVDSDGDGSTDESETQAGTDPLDPSSDLDITDIAVETTSTTPDGGVTVDISFPVVQGIIYRIQSSDNLTNWNTVWGPETPTDGVSVFNLKDIEIPLSNQGFLRVAVGLDPYE